MVSYVKIILILSKAVSVQKMPLAAPVYTLIILDPQGQLLGLR